MTTAESNSAVRPGCTARAETGSSPGTAALARAARKAGLRLSGLTVTTVCRERHHNVAPRPCLTSRVTDAHSPSGLRGLLLCTDGLDRAAHVRDDPTLIGGLLAVPATRVVAVRADRVLVGSDDRLVYRSPEASDADRLTIFLGREPHSDGREPDGDGERTAYLGVVEQPTAGDGDNGWRTLRAVGAQLSDRDAAVATTLIALANWHRGHEHCERCGGPTQPVTAGWVRRCVRNGDEHFPRMDSSVIMSVIDADDRLLLGRGVTWPENQFSVLAGFVEPGESLEAAVVREAFEEAGVPSYDADAYRTRRLADLDRAAATGHVPTALLSRWESALDDVTLWRFAPAPVHGGLTRSQVLAVFDSDDDAGSGHVRAVVGWEDARVADPAEDFAAVVTTASPGAVESVLEAYANSRIERPDPHLRRRALLASELGLLGELLAAVTLGVPDRVRAVADRLTQLSRQVEPDDLKAPAPVAVTPKEVPVPRDRTGAARATSAADLGSLEDTAAMAGPGRSAATDQLALVTDQDTVAMDPRTMFDATEEIPPEQLQAVRQAHAARETSRDETDRAPEDAAEPEGLKAEASKAEAAKVTEVAE